MSKSLIAATAAVGLAVAVAASPVQAGNGSAVGAGIVGFGVGAIIGSALAPREVYVVPPPPPPPPIYYGPVVYGPPAWTPAWYDYCGSIQASIRAPATMSVPAAAPISAADGRHDLVSLALAEQLLSSAQRVGRK